MAIPHDRRDRPSGPALGLFPFDLIPELKHRTSRSIGTILRKEQPTVRNLYYPLCAGYGVFEPVCPLLVEENVLQAPHDKRWDLQRLERGMNGDGVRVVEAQPVALESLDALLRGQQGCR